MGNEATKEALLELSAKTLEEQLKLAKLRQSGTVSKSYQSKHGWDVTNASSNLKVSEDCLTIKKISGPKQRVAARGCITYDKKVHIFEFQWNPGDRNKRTAIGVATRKAKLEAKKDGIVLGADDNSVGFNLVTREIFFNGTTVKKMLRNKPEDYCLPPKVIMTLDMDNGTISFKTQNENLGTAMKGLQHLSDSIYIAGELETEGDELTVRYLDPEQSMKPNIDIELAFHKICGKNVVLQDGNRRAMRKNPKTCFAHASVLTNRPLNDDEMFKLILVSKDTSQWSGSWNIGVTTCSPTEMKFAQEVTSCSQGKSYIMEGNHIRLNGKNVEEVNGDIDELDTGSTVGVKKRGNSLMFYIDGNKQITIKIDADEQVYGVVDIYGQATGVMMIGESPQMTDPLEQSFQSVTTAPKSSEEYLAQLKHAVDLLKIHSRDNMPRVKRIVGLNLDKMYHVITSRRIKQLAAEKLAKMDAAKIFTEYIKYLIEQDPEENELVGDIYETLLSVCWNYSDNSHLLAKKFGEAGLLDILIGIIKDNSDNYKRSKFAIINVLQCFGILHNCSKVFDNKPIYRRNNFMKVSKPYCDAKTTIKDIAMPAILTRSYVFAEDELDELKVPEPTVQDTVNTLAKAVDTEDTHQHDGWHAYELAVGINNLSANKENVHFFVQKGVISHLVKMLQFKEDHDKECALNTIWSLANDTNKQEISSTDNLMEKLKEMEKEENEDLKQAAIRVIMKLLKINRGPQDDILTTKIVVSHCEYKELSKRYKASLNISDSYFDSSFDMCFCALCHGDREEKTKYTRGKPPKEYGIPVTWYRFGLRLPPKADAFNALQDWHRAFHGTKEEYIKSIFEVGEIVPAGRAVLGGKKIKEQPGHYNENYKPDGFNTKQLFLSPSIRYSGVDAYAIPGKFTDAKTKTQYTTKVAFQVLIHPDSYSIQPETIGAMGEIDPGFSNQELEWSTEEQGSTILYGLLVKLEKT